ncbi:hypothetical protein EC973_007423 [Apophysomyces ossiformis]|uniref:HSF-type DNA-binding domain-containing protein n=1 Tax=Apophysomyces ossiformis TaxID=679940 RepID=A0A8H7EU80_9FUNG|nr:hypothetical protein EC973_007407 [Apophysomyces ossiformis]KAF7727549.1 hypothetical protein EC973_007423 [Apophysomyces ossiformis]
MTHHKRSSSTNSTSSSQYNMLDNSPMQVRTLPFAAAASPPPAPATYPPAYAQHLSVQPPPTQKPSHTNTFVHKLYNMVVDNQYQHLIAWSYTGSSFIVCNIMEFSRDVLPKHFKHNNFSSFVRQLNMYGFHKVNKSPRGHRTLAENQIWEFSHPKFLRNRPELLDDIKRKAMESDTTRRETGDLQAHITMLQASHSEMMQQISSLFENFHQVVKELADTKKRQQQQQQLVQNMMQYIARNNGGQLPPELNIDHFSSMSKPETPPSIFVTSHHGNNDLLTGMFAQSRPSSLHVSNQSRSDVHHRSPLLGPYTNHLVSSPSASSLVSDDESASLYSLNSPHTPHHTRSHSNGSQLTDSLGPTTGAESSPAQFAFVHPVDPLSHR